MVANPSSPDEAGPWNPGCLHEATALATRAALRFPQAPGHTGWGLSQIAECERRAATAPALQSVSYRCLGRVMSALFAVHGQPWGTRELITSLATDLACNIRGGELIGELIEPFLGRAAAEHDYLLLPAQSQPARSRDPSARVSSPLANGAGLALSSCGPSGA